MSVSSSPAPSQQSTASAGIQGERRRSGRRARARDRLMDRASRPYAPNESLQGLHDMENLLLFIDDDLRETGMALGRIEDYLIRTLGLLELREIDRGTVQALASDPDVLDHLDLLSETIESLRRRMAKLATRLK